MSRWLENRVAIITGGGSGIGRATAILMGDLGAKVVVADLGCDNYGKGVSPEAADRVVEEIRSTGGTAVASYENVGNLTGAHNIAECAMKNFGKVDILVNLAGPQSPSLLVDAKEEDVNMMIDAHIKGHIFCCKEVLPHMISKKYGRIINISSGAALGLKGQVVYSATKAAILGFTRSLAQEVEEYGINVNVLMPLAATRGLKSAQEHSFIALTPGFAYDQLPEDNAPIIAYLAGEKANNVTGRTFSLRYAGTVQLLSNPTGLKGVYQGKRWAMEDLDRVMPQLLA